MATNEGNLNWKEIALGALFISGGFLLAITGNPVVLIASMYVLFYLLSKELLKQPAGEAVGKLILVNAFLELIKLVLIGLWTSWYGPQKLSQLVAYTKYLDVIESIIIIIAVVIAIELLIADFIKKIVSKE